MKLRILSWLFSAWLLALPAAAQVPQIVNYQGRMAVGGVNFNGNGQFKFALVNGGGTVLWSNAPISAGQPNAHVVLPVTNGIYSVFLGDTTLANMAAVPATVFGGADVRLRIWFNNGAIGFQQLTPDQRIGAVGYAIMADGVKDGAITASKLAAGAVTSTAIAGGAVTSAALANGAVTSSAIANGAIGSSQLAAGAITAGSIADGSITGAKIANGTLTGTQIAAGTITKDKLFKQYDGGRVNIYDFDLTDFPTGKNIPLTFSAPFADPPSVSLGAEGADPAFLAALHPSVKAKSTTGFTLGLDGLSRTDTEILPVKATQISSRGMATRSVSAVDLMTLDTGPAMAYIENGKLVYRRALDSRGTRWGDAVLLDSAVDTGTRLDLSLQNGNPAVAYVTGSGTLYFIRATDATGTAWGARGTVIASGVNSRPVAGYSGSLPAIVVQDLATKQLQFCRATNAAGTTWAAPLILTATLNARANHWDFTTVNGQPAVVFSAGTVADDANLFYLRATSVDGTTWPASSTSVYSTIQTTKAGNNPRFLIINGNPAVFFAVTSYKSIAAPFQPADNIPGGVYCVRAQDANGSTWPAPSHIASGENGYLTTHNSFGTSTTDTEYRGEAGGIIQPGLVAGVPVLLTSRDVTTYSDSTNTTNFGNTQVTTTSVNPTRVDSLCLFKATDANGTAWSGQGNFGAASDKRPEGTLQSLNGNPCWASAVTNEATLVSAEAGSLVSRALPSPSASASQSNGALGAMTLPSGRPMLAFFDPGEKTLKVSTAADAYGTTWNTPKTVGAVGGGFYVTTSGASYAYHVGEMVYVGPFGPAHVGTSATGTISLGSVQEIPCIAFTNGSPTTLKFIKANGYDGQTWGSAITVFSGSGINVDEIQMVIANGNPAIFFRQDNSIKIVRATNTAGTAWGAPVTIVTDATLQLGFRGTLIAGNPAVVYGSVTGSNFIAKFLRATDSSGTAWPAPTTVQTATGFVAGTFHTFALAEVNGTPAIAFHFTNTGKLTYTRSGVVAGTGSWSAPVELDSQAGLDDSLKMRTMDIIPGAKPALIYQAADALFQSDVRCVLANDGNGTTWGAPFNVVTEGDVGFYISASIHEGGITAACYDLTRNLTIHLKSTDGAQTWQIADQGQQFPAGEHFCVAMGNGAPVVFFQMEQGLYIASATDPEGATWQFPNLVQGKFAGAPAGPGAGFFPSAVNIGGRLCVTFYDADFGNLWFMRGNTASGGFSNPAVNIIATNDVGGYSSLMEVGGRPAVAYYNFTNKTLHFSRAFDAIGSAWLVPVTVAGAGNGEYCQLTSLGGLPAILYYSSTGGKLMLVRALDANGVAWGTPETVDDGVTTTAPPSLSNGYQAQQIKADVGRFAKLAMVNGKPSVIYTDSTNKDLLYKRAGNATGTSWSERKALASSDDTGLFPTMVPIGSIPSVFHFDRARNSIRNILPTLPFSVNWTAVEP